MDRLVGKDMLSNDDIEQFDGITLSLAYLWILPVDSVSRYVDEISLMMKDIEENRQELCRKTSDCMELVLYLFSTLDTLKSTFDKAVVQTDDENRRGRLALLSETAVSVSHLWREPLSLVHINMQNIAEELSLGIEDEDYLKSCLNNCKTQLERMRRAVRMFLEFIRESKDDVIDVMALLDELHAFISEYYEKDGIGFVFHSSAEQVNAKGSASLLKQVLLAVFSASRKLVEDSQKGVGIIIFSARVENSCSFELKTQSLITDEGGTLNLPARILETEMQGKISISFNERGTLFQITLN